MDLVLSSLMILDNYLMSGSLSFLRDRVEMIKYFPIDSWKFSNVGEEQTFPYPQGFLLA